MEDEMSTENKQKEKYVEWINHYLEKADAEQARLVFIFVKGLIE